MTRKITNFLHKQKSRVPVSKKKSKCGILYLVGGLGRGGLERQLCYLLQSMDRKRYNPVVVVWNHSDGDAYVSLIRSLGVPVQFLPEGTSPLWRLIKFCSLVKELQPDVLHSYSFYTNFAVWVATLGTSAIPVGSIRQNFFSEREVSGKVLGRLSARWPRTQICNSLITKTAIERSSDYAKPKLVYAVRNRLDVEQFTFHPVPNKIAHLLAVGRFFPEKRWDRLLRCLAVIATRGLKFTFSHAGDGPLRGELESMVTKFGLNSYVRFLGHRDDIPELMKNATFLVHTSDDEGCPNVVMEAMACGRAVVATDAGDVPLLVEDGITGFLVHRGDDDTLVEAMVKLISDYDLSSRMGEAARTKAEKNFGLIHLAADTLHAYRMAGWENW